MHFGYSVLFLALVTGYQCEEFCSFASDLCSWHNIHPCKFKHITNTPLAGETGYLMLSKNTCKKAAIAFKHIQYIHSFQMRYFINGTGDAYLTVIAEYVMAGPRHVWNCRNERGPNWNNAQIIVKDGIFDQLNTIIIEAVVDGDATIAIGDIKKSINNQKETSCSASPASTELDAEQRITNKTLKTEEELLPILKVRGSQKNHNIKIHPQISTPINRILNGNTHKAIKLPVDPSSLLVTPKIKRKQVITDPEQEKRHVSPKLDRGPARKHSNKKEPGVKRPRTSFPVRPTVDSLHRASENGPKRKPSLTISTPIIINRSKIKSWHKVTSITRLPTEPSSLLTTRKPDQTEDKKRPYPKRRNITSIVDSKTPPKHINNINQSILKHSSLSNVNETLIDSLPPAETDSEKELTLPNSELRWSVVIGGSLFAMMLLIMMFTFSIILYKRKIDILNVYEVDGRSLVNNLYG